MAVRLSNCSVSGTCLSFLGPEQSTSLRASAFSNTPGADSTARIESKAELDTSLAVGEEAGDAELKVGAEFDAASPNEGESVLPPTSQHGHTCVWGQALPVQLPSLASVSQGGLPDVFIRLELVGTSPSSHKGTVVGVALVSVSSLVAAGAGTTARRKVPVVSPAHARGRTWPTSSAAAGRLLGEVDLVLAVSADDTQVDEGPATDVGVAHATSAGLRREVGAVRLQVGKLELANASGRASQPFEATVEVGTRTVRSTVEGIPVEALPGGGVVSGVAPAASDAVPATAHAYARVVSTDVALDFVRVVLFQNRQYVGEAVVSLFVATQGAHLDGDVDGIVAAVPVWNGGAGGGGGACGVVYLRFGVDRMPSIALEHWGRVSVCDAVVGSPGDVTAVTRCAVTPSGRPGTMHVRVGSVVVCDPSVDGTMVRMRVICCVHRSVGTTFERAVC